MGRASLFSAISGVLLLLSVFFVAGSGSVARPAHPLEMVGRFVKQPVVSTMVATTGCGKPSPIPAGTSAYGVLRSSGLMRAYRLHVPRGYVPTLRTPLVLNFHGHGSTAQKQEEQTGFSVLADQDDFLIAYPQGTIGPDGHTGWATGEHKDPIVDDVGFVSDLITHLQSLFCVDPQRIYATGFSNGGAMTAKLACTMAGRIAAFAPVSGSYVPLVSGCHPDRPVPILEIHGTADMVVPYGGSHVLDLPSIAMWLSDWAVRDGCSSQSRVFFQEPDITGERWTNCRDGSTVVHYRITDGKHTWPGAGVLPQSKATQVFNATGVIWSFLHSYSLPSEGSAQYTRQ